MLLLNEHEPSTSSRVERTVGSVQTIQQACNGCAGWGCEGTGAKKGFRERVSTNIERGSEVCHRARQGRKEGKQTIGTNTLNCEPVGDA